MIYLIIGWFIFGLIGSVVAGHDHYARLRKITFEDILVEIVLFLAGPLGFLLVMILFCKNRF